MGQPLVYLLVLNYCSPDDCIECIAAIRQVTYPNLRLLVLDNASPDDSIERLRPLLAPGEFVALPENIGYAGGNNQGLLMALEDGADYIFILNPDVRITPDSVSSYVTTMEDELSISALNPIQLAADGQSFDRLFRRAIFDANGYETPALPLHGGQSWEVRTLFGAALFLRRNTLETVGGFDPLYFAYWEEVDLCRRIKYHGGRLIVTSAEPIIHLRSYQAHKPDPFRLFLRLKGMYLYRLKDPDMAYSSLLGHTLLELARCTAIPCDNEFNWGRGDYLRALRWCISHAVEIRSHRKVDRLGRAYL